MIYSLQISKKLLTRWLPPKDKDQRIILIDLEPDIVKDNDLHLDLNVAVHPIRLNLRKIGGLVQYFIGSSAVLVRVEAENGKIKNYSPEQTINVKYNNSITRKRNSTFKVAPEGSLKYGTVEGSIKGIETSFEAGKDSVFSTSYSGEERRLTVLNTGNELEWELLMPRGEKVISDFFTGNIYLFAVCSWSDPLPAKGKIYVRSTKTTFFDENRQPLGKFNSLMMEITLFEEQISKKLKRKKDKSLSLSESSTIEFDFTFKNKE